jgi:hypothetical protein
VQGVCGVVKEKQGHGEPQPVPHVHAPRLHRLEPKGPVGHKIGVRGAAEGGKEGSKVGWRGNGKYTSDLFFENEVAMSWCVS